DDDVDVRAVHQEVGVRDDRGLALLDQLGHARGILRLAGAVRLTAGNGDCLLSAAAATVDDRGNLKAGHQRDLGDDIRSHLAAADYTDTHRAALSGPLRPTPGKPPQGDIGHGATSLWQERELDPAR